MEAVPRARWSPSASLAVVSIIFSLAALCLFSYFAGASPLKVMLALFQGALQGRYALTTTLSEWVAMTLSGLAVLIPYRAGFFNVGGQGQLEVGALAAAAVTLSLAAPGPLVMVLALLAAVAAGVLAVSIPLILRLRRGASEVTTTIMMNFACVQFMYAMVTGPLKDPKSWYGTTPPVPEACQLPSFPPGSGVPAGMWVAALIALAAWWLMHSTVFGLYLRAVGGNRSAAVAAGIPVEDVVIDPLVMAVGADSHAAAVTLETIRLVKEKLGVNVNLGASNVSHGLPERPLVNLAFLALAMGAGATCAITDPEKTALFLRAGDLLLGRDGYGMRYIKTYRKIQQVLAQQAA